MSRMIILLVVAFFYIAIDTYCYNGLAQIIGSIAYCPILYWAASALVIGGFFLAGSMMRKHGAGVRSPFVNILLGFCFAIIVGKVVFMLLLIPHDVIRFISGLLGFNGERNDLVLAISGTLGGIATLALMYGSTRGKYSYKTDEVVLQFPDLPEAFQGFTLAQISDVHSGTFDSVKMVEKGIQQVLDTKADMIVFTGDLVNSHKDEIDPYLDTFAQLNAPYGVFSIMGNHDYYGMYGVQQRGTIDDTRRYMMDFERKHQYMGFQLLKNESLKIEKEGASIRLVGVENWGNGPFPKVGDLDRALDGVDQDEFTILLSHDPTHWDYHVRQHRKQIHLTLSGHTHGMQFGINIGKFQWSPVKYRYKRWMGLYQEGKEYLYVNRGFGFLGFPGRVGMSPEITLIRLEKGE